MSARQSVLLFLLVLVLPLLLAYAVIVSNQVGAVYGWFLVAHLTALFAFMLSHGASALLSFRIESLKDSNMARMYIGLARDPVVVLSTGASLGLVLSTGISLGFFGSYWGKGWIWAVLGAAIFVTISMSVTGRRELDKALKAIEAGSPPVRGYPQASAVVGILGLVVILWLIIFKPF
jgi:hypothetical protein